MASWLNSGTSQQLAAPERQDDPSAEPKRTRWTWDTVWSKHVGVIPLPIYLLLIVVLAGLAWQDDLAPDIPHMAALLGVCGYTCLEVGRRIPVFRAIGGSVILVTFLPAFLVAQEWIPKDVAEHISTFYESSNMLYVFISGIIVGSILSMNREILVKGLLKIFLPLLAGSVAALLVGSLVGWAITGDLEHTIFYIVVPVMGGGLGEGAVPLTLGYSQSGAGEAGTLLAQVLPVILFANVCAILCASALSVLGRRRPHTTGNGRLQPSSDADDIPHQHEGKPGPFNVRMLAAAGFMVVGLYLIGQLAHVTLDWPAPIVMLGVTIALKLSRKLPLGLERHASIVYDFMSTSVAYPLMFAVGVASTPWDELVQAFSLATVVTIIATVVTMVCVAYLVASRLRMYPVDTAIVIGTHSGLGGTGDVAILSAARRMELMPFAQVATRIGGAVTVSLALVAFTSLH
ncbi:2-hydroxycarboxylate transporter family protein [Streptomyces sp. NBC_00006]|uniref:2-hydroxycarboxylate transporter family protein n=1 Tax=unclassified Streptomyces TaxID=2593676 RepID=UPI002259CE1C|nr:MULTISPECIES: 2-hydroxycarboxylate transporter family protein [unclassified Streptomyces]MCX5535862.1 2-hydroxycarboxylate transporter family protein [Streptomyces sp. NBC_00006]